MIAFIEALVIVLIVGGLILLAVFYLLARFGVVRDFEPIDESDHASGLTVTFHHDAINRRAIAASDDSSAVFTALIARESVVQNTSPRSSKTTKLDIGTLAPAG